MSDSKPITRKTGHYRVDYEYAKLREVVLGGTQTMLPHKGTIFDKYITYKSGDAQRTNESPGFVPGLFNASLHLA